MDFFLGAIVGVSIYAIVLKVKEQRDEQKKPRRGRPPKSNDSKKGEI